MKAVRELFQGRTMATGAAVLAGSLSLYGCTTYKTENSSSAPTLGHNKLYVPGRSGGDSTTYSCDGANLHVKEGGDATVYLNDPACADHVFDLHDIQAKH